MNDFWKRLFGWIGGFVFIIAFAFFIVGLETGEGFFGVIENIASKVELDPFASIKEEAFERGREAGFKAGERSGYNNGLRDGKRQMLQELSEEGKTYDAGYNDGYKKGKEDGKSGGAKIVWPSSDNSSEETKPESEPEVPSVSYVLNKNTKKFHLIWCASVGDIKSSNRWDFSGTREEVIAMGYVPCKRCNP